MELRHLRYFVAVSESLHFSQAALRLGIAQPSLSHQIRQLEMELQTALLRRTKRRVELTDAGRLFLEQAREILARVDRAAVIAQRTGRGGTGQIRVGLGYCMDQRELGIAIRQFNRQHGSVHVELRTMAVRSQLESLRREQLDVGFVRPPLSDLSLASEIVDVEPLMVAVPSDHRVSNRPSVALATLANDPFVLPAHEAVPVYHDIILQTCREAGFVPISSHEVDHLSMVLAMVEAGTGVALVPAFVRDTKRRRVALVPLRPAPPALQIAIAWRREDVSPELDDFLKIIRGVFAQKEHRGPAA